jgi:glycosyltransferase 2 family protein
LAAPRGKALQVAKLVFAVAVIAGVTLAVVEQWDAVKGAAEQARPRWGIIALSCAVVLVNYAMLIEVWRTVLAGWGGHLDFWPSARIWTISNLGRYVPGKVWQMGTMAMMAQQRGVSGVAAASSAVIVTLINTVAGFVVLAATGARVLAIPTAGFVAITGVGLALLLTPRLVPWLGALAGRLVGRNVVIPKLPYRAIWTAAIVSALSWIGYGIAFRLLAVGVLGYAAGALSLYTAVFTGSYLLGFLALFAPGGLGVREYVMATALEGAGYARGEAILLVVASRLWLTVLEILPAVIFLAHRWVRPRPPDASIEIRV